MLNIFWMIALNKVTCKWSITITKFFDVFFNKEFKDNMLDYMYCYDKMLKSDQCLWVGRPTNLALWWSERGKYQIQTCWLLHRSISQWCLCCIHADTPRYRSFQPLWCCICMKHTTACCLCTKLQTSWGPEWKCTPVSVSGSMGWKGPPTSSQSMLVLRKDYNYNEFNVATTFNGVWIFTFKCWEDKQKHFLILTCHHSDLSMANIRSTFVRDFTRVSSCSFCVALMKAFQYAGVRSGLSIISIGSVQLFAILIPCDKHLLGSFEGALKF